MEGIQVSIPFTNILGFLRALSPDELECFKTFAAAVASLNRYLMDPSAQNPSQWQQCLCCLQVNHISIIKDDWWAQYHTTNQHMATTCAMILNTMIRNFLSEALHCVDAEQNRAWDQIVTRFITSNPPPFDTDPWITEWIEYKATVLCSDMRLNVA